MIEWLIERQKVEGLSDRRFIDRIGPEFGMKFSNWGHIRRGHIRPNLTCEQVNAVIRVWPEHRAEIVQICLPILGANSLAPDEPAA